MGIEDPNDRSRLTRLVSIEADYYRVRRVERPPRFAGDRDVADYDDIIGQAVLVVGDEDAPVFADLVPFAVADVERVEASSPGDVQPNLGVLAVLNDLQIMGLPFPPATLAVAAVWLRAMPTADAEPELWHWERGLAALALGDLVTARGIAALPIAGPSGVDTDVDPEFNIQAWLALFVAAVVGEVPAPLLAARWEEFVVLTPVFVEINVLALRDLSWVARIVRHVVAGEPLDGVADWLHRELFRIAGLSWSG